MKKENIYEKEKEKKKGGKIKLRTKSGFHGATLKQLKLYGGADDQPTVLVTSAPNVRRAVDVQVVVAGNPRAHLPFDAPVDLDVEEHGSGVQIQRQGLLQVGRDRDGVSGQERRPNCDFLVALVGGGQERREGDQLVPVRGVGVELDIVDANAVVGVLGGDGDLHDGRQRERRGLRHGEVLDGDVLKGKTGLGWPQDNPNQEHRDGQEDEYDGDAY